MHPKHLIRLVLASDRLPGPVPRVALVDPVAGLVGGQLVPVHLLQPRALHNGELVLTAEVVADVPVVDDGRTRVGVILDEEGHRHGRPGSRTEDLATLLPRQLACITLVTP